MDNRKHSFVMVIEGTSLEGCSKLVIYPRHSEGPDAFAHLVSTISQALGANDPKDLVVEIEASETDQKAEIVAALSKRSVPHTIRKYKLAKWAA